MASNKDMSFWQRLRFKFRVTVLNETTLDEVFHIRLSWIRILLLLFLTFIIAIGIISILIIYTPVRKVLPGYVDDTTREELIASTMIVDSLSNEVELQARYSDMIREILAGQVSSDSVVQLDSVERRELLTEKSRLMEEFKAEYEAKEKYELELFVGQLDVRKYVFFKPSQGVIAEDFSPTSGLYGIKLATTRNSNVTSVLQGTVIYTDYTLENGWSIIVQHDNEYVSVYKNNIRLLKRVGDVVKAGEILAIAGTDNGEFCIFELWQKGTPIDPATVIAF